MKEIGRSSRGLVGYSNGVDAGGIFSREVLPDEIDEDPPQRTAAEQEALDEAWRLVRTHFKRACSAEADIAECSCDESRDGVVKVAVTFTAPPVLCSVEVKP